MDPTATSDLSIVGLTIQVMGVAAIAGLFRLLHGAMPRAYFTTWSNAWLMMAGALLALRLALAYPSVLWPLEGLYYLGEYGFAMLLARGFQRYPDRSERSNPSWFWYGVGGVVWSAILTNLPVAFAVRFGIHALVFAALLAFALWRLSHIRLPRGHAKVKAFAAIGLTLLTLNFGASGLIVGWLTAFQKGYAESYVAYQSIIDLVFEQVLAFGLVAIATVDMRTTLERARTAMQGERDRMAMLAHQDGLTGCFNRLALAELKRHLGGRSGCVAMVDLNYLKPLNDQLGHAVGDLAICQVANTLKAVLRPGDHVFRLGGDEFVVVGFDMESPLALDRLQEAQERLRGVVLCPEHTQGLEIARGVCEFKGSVDFDAALEKADSAMYAHKQSGRTSPPR